MNTEMARSAKSGETVPQNRHVFIVDDDESVCRALRILLGTFGFTADTFTAAADFFSTVPNSAPGCLILDIHMPGLDGWKTLQRIIESGSNRPVIVISADKHGSNYDRALKEGAVGYLMKPFSDRELVDLITGALEKQNRAPQE